MELHLVRLCATNCLNEIGLRLHHHEITLFIIMNKRTAKVFFDINQKYTYRTSSVTHRQSDKVKALDNILS
jgi:hypothetical protein